MPPWLAAALALLLVLGGCAASEPRPALVSKAEVGNYGYSEAKLSATRYEITYESPRFDVPVSGSRRAERLEHERQRAYDFALWHAAEIAKADGFAALAVEQDRRDVDVSLRTQPNPHFWPGYYGPFGPPFHPFYYRHPWRYAYDDDCCWPGYGGYYSGYRQWATARVTVVLQVRLLKEASDDALAVDATLARLSSAYGRPTYP